MKSNKMINMTATLKAALAGAAIGWLCWQTGIVCHAQTAASNLSPDLQEVVKLSQSHMGDDVIVTYIRSSGKSYKLSADDILYLNGQGVSQGVISALQNTGAANSSPAPGVPAPATSPSPSSQPAPVQVVINQYGTPGSTAPAPAAAPVPPAAPTGAPPEGGPEINFQYFHDQLSPFGSWVVVGGQQYWHPDQAIAANPDWRPYYDMGQWAQTDNGLFWQSDYTWGDIPFHYGRWILNPVYGWLWAPDYVWGPAWVFWRHAEGDASIGWAPMPVGAVFLDGVFMFNGLRVGLDFDFGLGESCFTFVGYDHFHEGFFRMRGHEWGYHIGHERLHSFYGRSVIRNEFRRDEHGRFVNNGIGRDRIEHLTHVTHSNFEERHPVGDRNLLAKQREEHTGARNVGHSGGINSGSHVAGGSAGNTGNTGTGNAGHSGGVNSGSHVGGGGGAGNTGHTGTGNPDNGSVNKVFRPPTPASKPVAPSKPTTPPQSGGQKKKQ